MDVDLLDRAGLECACFNLRKAARSVTQLYDEALKPVGLFATQLPILGMLSKLGSATITQLAEGVVMDRTTLTRNLRPLERDGLVRTRPGTDRRVREVSLTKKGETLLLKALPVWRDVQGRVVQSLGRTRAKHLLAELRATVAALHDLEE
jgi:DNA-binding MarR family transcriptional regulator